MLLSDSYRLECVQAFDKDRMTLQKCELFDFGTSVLATHMHSRGYNCHFPSIIDKMEWSRGGIQ